MIDLQHIAAEMAPYLDDNHRPEADTENPLTLQALCVAEEAGELVKAYRRWAGLARTNGPKEAVEDEVADVFIVTALFAHRAGINIEKAIEKKLHTIYSRGWRNDT